MLVEIRLYATLRRYAPPHAVAGVFSADIPELSTITELLSTIHVPPKEVHILMVNGIRVTFKENLKAGDRLGIFPAIGGG